MCDPGICQLRLDFDTFSLSSPDKSAIVAGETTPNVHTQCLEARFVAVSDGGNVPVICGTNSGMHSRLINYTITFYSLLENPAVPSEVKYNITKSLFPFSGFEIGRKLRVKYPSHL